MLKKFVIFDIKSVSKRLDQRMNCPKALQIVTGNMPGNFLYFLSGVASLRCNKTRSKSKKYNFTITKITNFFSMNNKVDYCYPG